MTGNLEHVPAESGVIPEERATPLTVSQLTRRVRFLLEREIGNVMVQGEVSNWRVYQSGHAYFSLKDDASVLPCVMFAHQARRLRFTPENGLAVVAQGRVSVYERDGRYQLYVESMQPAGWGALQLAYEQLRKKLEAEGLFDPARKKNIPRLPERIGVVTSPRGAAIRDILNVLRRRFSSARVLISPTRVQGEGAAMEIAEAIRLLDGRGVDVIIVARGGGSMEDLWAFNEEPVVRAVAACVTPVVTGVGHETDTTLVDFAADLRAPTPSAAAEMVVREKEALRNMVRELFDRARRVTTLRCERCADRLEQVSRSLWTYIPDRLFKMPRVELDRCWDQLERTARDRLARTARHLDTLLAQLNARSPVTRLRVTRERLRGAGLHLKAVSDFPRRLYARQLTALGGKLHALSPLAVLGRGYALAWRLPDRALIRSASILEPGDMVEVRFGQGSVTAAVREIHESRPAGDNAGGHFGEA
ncbi:MAG TPA: exodeoxyribonuclease VII large subunit [Candidatus Hydrogenedentes bacterium]|nr:exodeoxyribonuclease VII large subunit [Candidatus Hydrogenedentota bacterium]